jgi:hypothetical protein
MSLEYFTYLARAERQINTRFHCATDVSPANLLGLVFSIRVTYFRPWLLLMSDLYTLLLSYETCRPILV